MSDRVDSGSIVPLWAVYPQYRLHGYSFIMPYATRRVKERAAAETQA